jgi:hypothetical protein
MSCKGIRRFRSHTKFGNSTPSTPLTTTNITGCEVDDKASIPLTMSHTQATHTNSVSGQDSNNGEKDKKAKTRKPASMLGTLLPMTRMIKACVYLQ